MTIRRKVIPLCTKRKVTRIRWLTPAVSGNNCIWLFKLGVKGGGKVSE